jgi:hypothetical protein
LTGGGGGLQPQAKAFEVLSARPRDKPVATNAVRINIVYSYVPMG